MTRLAMGARALLSTTACALVAITAAMVATPTLRAQGSLAVSGGAGITSARLSREGTLDRAWTGAIMGAGGTIRLNRFLLDAQYAQGTLTPEAGTLGDGEDVVDGALQLRFRVLPWLTVGAGPHIRAFITPAGTSRWTRFEGRVRAEGELINSIAFAHVEGWFAAAVDANVQGGGSGAKGGEAGVLVRLPRTPLALQLTYLADRAEFANGASEFLEGVRVTVLFDRY